MPPQLPSTPSRRRASRFRAISLPAFILLSFLGLAGRSAAEEGAPYAAMLAALRSEIASGLPQVDAEQRRKIVDGKDSEARIEELRKTPGLDRFLADDGCDTKLARFFVLHDATPAGLAAYARQGAAHKKRIDDLLADERLLLQIAVADGARPLETKRRKAPVAQYGRAMEIYETIQETSPQAREGVLQRLALAVSLELSEPIRESEPGQPEEIVPLERYRHFEKAYLAGELDPAFDRLSVWDLRFVVCAPETDEALGWGREMLRTFRPDHVYNGNARGRYVNVVGTDIRYGSIDVRNDRPELMGVQNILMNGGICGRRAFFARYICRAFGIPATARPSSGHGASARWSPDGWLVVLGPGWRHGWTTTRYRNDLDFLATTQARATGDEFLKVKRAYWIGDVLGERRCYAEFDEKAGPAFWNAVALATQRRIIGEAEASALGALGAELGEADGRTVAEAIAATAADCRVIREEDGTITIPAAAHTVPGSSTEDVVTMNSFGGGLQVFLPRFFQQKPILVRGGSWQHEADLCASATRHWRGRRPKKSYFMRGMRVAVTPEDSDGPKELVLDLGDDVTMELVYIPPGTFTMGGDRDEKAGDILADTPRHEVTLTKGFYLGKREVTQAQYAAVMDREQGKSGKGPDHPVDGVKPYTALLFCEELSTRTGVEVRLPSEAEWEYAARAGTDTRWFFGDDSSKLGDYAWFKDNAEGKSHPVGLKKPNPWGLHDMYGNIAEFVRDEHQEDYYAQGPKVDPVGPLLGIHSSMTYTVKVPEAGTYTLTTRVATPNVGQSLQLAVNAAASPVTLRLPFTIGLWGDSEPVTIHLAEGENTLHFWRDRAPQSGVAVKSFTLRPVGGR